MTENLYRAVGIEEYYDITRTKKFAVLPNWVNVKYFGLNFEETLLFANKNVNIGIVAIFEVKIAKDVLLKTGDFTRVDTFIFKSGTVEIPGEYLEEFNNAIQELTHKY